MLDKRKFKIILLLSLLVLFTGCFVFEQTNYRHCVYYEEDGLYYDTRDNLPCTSLNKKLEKNRK